MLAGARVPDAIRFGLGLAARGVGEWCDLYRPDGAGPPLAPARRVMRLPAAFTSAQGAQAPVGYGEALWQGLFDAAYTLPGDYIVGPDGVFFIAALPRLSAPLCVRTNRTLSFARPVGAPFAGVNRYVAAQERTAERLLQEWPASVLAVGRGGRVAMPGEAAGAPGWEALLPEAGAVLRPGDLVTDERGRVCVVSSAELSFLGWRLHLRQAGV